MKKLIILSVLAIAFVTQISAQSTEIEKGLNAISIDALKAQTGFLASEWTEGRETGAKGEYISADYIASMLQLYGVKPGGDYRVTRDRITGKVIRERTYFQSFSLMTSSPGEVQKLSASKTENGAKKTIDFEHNTDFMINASYPAGSVEAAVVFVGYGYVDKENDYNDFAGLDIRGKIILRLSGLPRTASSSNNPFAYSRGLSTQKDLSAIENGAVAILEVDPSNIDGSVWSPQPEFLNMSPSESGQRRQRVRYSISNDKMNTFLPKASISLKVANAMLEGSGINISDFANGSGKTIKAVKGFNSRVSITTSVKSSFIRVRNVVGMIEGNNTSEAIVLGAHYDHLGSHNGYIYNGADDNASGTVGVMTIARAINATGVKPDKTLVFALWTGEEKGLLGSRYYADNPTVPLESIRLNLNFDMISRYMTDGEPNKVTMMYSPACPELKEMTINNLKAYNIDLEPVYLMTDNPPGGTDHRSFINKGIPYLRYKPGHREEYHSPEDEISTLDWDIMEKIVKLSFLNIWQMSGNSW